MALSRRSFLAGLGAAAGTMSAAGLPRIRAMGGPVRAGELLVVATWPFARSGTEHARSVLLEGGSALDAVEQGIRAVEVLGNGSVGLSGHPNAAGYVQQDACIMNGPGHRAGAVAGIEGIVHPISAARRVMEESPHVMLVGEGARWFALQHGLETVDVRPLTALKDRWQAEHAAPASPSPGEPAQVSEDDHDTVAMLVLHGGDIAGGCSTSGAGGKLPGRVGDSPLLGSGLYVDNRFGAAGGTGLGENAMRHCASFQIVELLRAGMAPAEACAEVLHRIAEHDPLAYGLQFSFCALDKKGRWGAATTDAFSCSVTTATHSEVYPITAIAPR